LLFNLQRHFLHTDPFLNFAYVLLERVFCTFCGTFFRPTTSYKKPRRKQVLANKTKDGCEKSALLFPAIPKRRQIKDLQHLPKTLAQNRSFACHLCFYDFRQRELTKSLSTRTKKSANQTKVSIALQRVMYQEVDLQNPIE